MKFIKRLFSREEKPVTVTRFISDIETKLEQFKLNEKAVSRMADTVKELDASIKDFKDKIAEFSRENERMNEISDKVIEVVSHILTMDSKINQIERKIEEIQKAVGLEEQGPEGELKKKSNHKQATFEL
jgi:predicted RNase H-like nuclease (RuvC/YqgF family)